MRRVFAALSFALLMVLPLAAQAAGGYISGRFFNYQYQGNFCPTTRDCTGACYLQSEFQTDQPVRNALVYVYDNSGGVIGQGTTDYYGAYTISWYSPTAPTAGTVGWISQEANGRFRVTAPSSGQVWLMKAWPMAFTDGTSQYSPQSLGDIFWGSPSAPFDIGNVFDGANKMWNNSLRYSNRMLTSFTGVDIRSFSNNTPRACPSSCAYQNGSTYTVQLDTNAAYAPQARIMHEMGHIGRMFSNNWRALQNYCYPSTSGSSCFWLLNSPQWRADSFEEGFATFLGDVALYWSGALEPHTCIISSAACATNSFNEETSQVAPCSATAESRWPLTVVRYLWDDYDVHVDGVLSEAVQESYGTFFDTIGYYSTGVNDLQNNEPFDSIGNVDNRDGRSGQDFSDNTYNRLSVDDWPSWHGNCYP